MASPTTTTVGIKDIAEKLGVEPRALRAFIRTLDLGVGRGTRYAWPSLSDPTVKRIIREYGKAQANDAADADGDKAS
jgi:hypothetical protein